MMRHQRIFSGLWALAALGMAGGLAGCTTTPLPDGTELPSSISFSSSICYGTCPAYKVTVRSDGSATWEGGQFVALKGVRQFSVSDEDYRAFARTLAPIRPNGTRAIVAGSPDCGPAATDHHSTLIEWEDGTRKDRLDFYHGCHNPANAPIAEAVAAAPEHLPIDAFIGDPATAKP